MAPELPAPSDSARRLRATNTLLTIVIVILLGQLVWQHQRINALKADVHLAQQALAANVERLAADRIKSLRREELASMVQWLDEFYRSPEGLQRPDGLWRADTHTPDSEAIAVWILDVYLQARMSGKSGNEARDLVAGQIKSTDEWRKKHPKTKTLMQDAGQRPLVFTASITSSRLRSMERDGANPKARRAASIFATEKRSSPGWAGPYRGCLPGASRFRTSAAS
jgi:hypothetical protein